MGELILSQFKNSGIPALSLTPTITIRQEDGTVIINGDTMTEISNGRYKYDFVDYNKKVTYLIDVDGGNTLSDTDRYQSTTNILDSYDNKKDRGRGGGGVVQNIDTKQLAKDVWLEKTRDYENKDGTMGNKLIKLDTQEVLDQINKLEIPNYENQIGEINTKADEIKNDITKTQGIVRYGTEKVVSTVQEIEKTVANITEGVNTQSQEIKDRIDTVGNEVKAISFDYERIENAISEKAQSNLPVLKQIEDIKEELKKEINKGNKSDLKEFLLKSIENQQEFERKTEELELQNQMRLSLKTIESNLSILNDKQIDFQPIFTEIKEISNQIEVGNKSINENLLDLDTKKQLEDQYKKSMKYIIYIAKNISNINKSDLTEIKKSLLSMKK